MANTANIALSVPVIEATVTLTTPAPTVSIAVTTGGARGPQGPAGEESGTALQPEDMVRLGSVPQIVPETHIADHIDRRILGLTANASTMDLYSTLDNSGSGTYVRNATNWAADIDWTCICAYNSAAASGVNGGGPTVISPLHGIAANHYTSSYTIGATVRFVTADDVVVSRTIDSVQQVGSTDIQVVKFSSALPATITPAKVLPANYADVLDLIGLPAAKTDKDQNLLVADLDTAYSLAAPSDAQRLTFYEAGISGDSGSPAFVIIDGAPVMLFGLESATAGAEIATQISGINSAMATLGGGYSLTQVSLPATSPSIPWDNITGTPALGTGDVTGPASATADAVPLFNGTTGKILKNGYATSQGGNGTDEGKVVRFGTAGALVGVVMQATDGSGHSGFLNAQSLSFLDDSGSPTVEAILTGPLNDQTITWPATTGTLALTTTNFPASQITSGTLDDARIPSGIARDSEVAAAYQPLDAQLTSLAGLSYAGNGSKVVRVNAGETAFEVATLTGGGNAQTADPLSQFAATTSAQLRGVLTDETGTGAAVFATSPTLTTPRIAAICDTNGNEALGTFTNASAVNFVQVVNGATGYAVAVEAAGDDTNVGLTLQGKGTGVITLASDVDANMNSITNALIPASSITSGTLAHEQGGLEADVSAYSGLVKISGGATSAVATSSGGNGAADSAKVPVYDSLGNLWMKESIHISGDNEVQVQPNGDLAYIDNGLGGKSCVIELGANPNNQTFTLPNESGVIVTTIHAQTLEDKTISGTANTITNLNASNLSSGTVAVARGGTGAATLAANNVLLGNGTSAVQVVAPGSSGNVLTSNGTTWQSTTPAAGSGPTIVYTSADQDITATSLADVTSLSYSLASNEQVEFTARLRVVGSASTEAPRPAINGPAGLVYLTASAQWAYAITTTQEEPIIAYETAAAFTQSSTSERLLTVSGTLINGATSGTLQIRCATETASGGAKVTIKAGSSLTVHSE